MSEIIDRHLPTGSSTCSGSRRSRAARRLSTPSPWTSSRSPPGKTSEIHRHNGTDTVLLVIEGSGTISVGGSSYGVRPGTRLIIGKGVFHGVRTEGEGLTFLSVQSPPILDEGRGVLDLEPLGG